MTRTTRAVLSSVAVAALASCVGDGTPPVGTVAVRDSAGTIVTSDLACDTCRIVFERVVSLGSLEDSSGFTFESTVGRSSAGDFYVAPMAHAGKIWVYDSEGLSLIPI